MDNLNEFQADLQQDLDAEDKAIAADGAYEDTPAEHWAKIMEIMATLKVQCADLEDSLKDFNKSSTLTF